MSCLQVCIKKAKKIPILSLIAALGLLLVSYFLLRRASLRSNSPPTLHIYGWSEYFPEDLQAEFTKQTGIRLVYSTYESNELMYAKLKASKSAPYDLIMPSSYFLKKMQQEGMLRPLDSNRLKNLGHLNKRFLNPNTDYSKTIFSVPYVWGVTGIGWVNDGINPKPNAAWKTLWSPEYKNSVALLDDAREVFCMVAQSLPDDSVRVLPRSEETWGCLNQALRKLQPNILVFNVDSPQYPYVAGEVKLGMLWSGAARLAQQEGYPVEFLWPEEGALLWVDHLAVPAQAPHPELVYSLLNFLTQPRVAARLIQASGFGSCNQTALDLLPLEERNNDMINPTEALWSTVIPLDYSPDNQAEYEDHFQKFKALWG